MGGGPKGERGNKGGVGDGEGGGCGSYRPCRTVEHLIVLSGSLGGFFVSGDNKHSAPECGFECLKLTLLICV